MMASTAADRGRQVRQRLLAAAVELIAERGWTGVSTRTIAERAGVATGVVHYHFASVGALLAEAALGVVREVLEQAGPLVDRAGSPDEALALLVGSLDRYDGTDPISLLFTETFLAATRDADLHRELGAIVVGFSDRLAARFAEHGVAEPAATAAVLAAAIDGVMLHRALRADLTAETVVPVLRRLVVPAAGGHADQGRGQG